MNVSNIVRRVAPWAPGCPTPVIEQALSDAMRDFCIKTDIWKESLPTEYTTAGDPNILLTAPGFGSVSKVVSVSINDKEDDDEWTFSQPLTLVLNTAPLASGLTVDVVATLATGYGDTAVPAVVEPWEKALAYGAIANLTEMPGKSWTNFDFHGLYTARFDEKIIEARGQNNDRSGKRYRRLRTTSHGKA